MHRKHLTPYISSSKNGRATPDISQENQPIKKQKIDDGGIQPVSYIKFYVFLFFLEIVGYSF